MERWSGGLMWFRTTLAQDRSGVRDARLHYCITPTLPSPPLPSQHSMTPVLHHSAWRLEVRVAGAEHGGEPGGLLFAPAALAGLLEMPMVAHRLERPFAVNLFLEPPQGFVN